MKYSLYSIYCGLLIVLLFVACDENPKEKSGSNNVPSAVALKELEEKSNCTGDLEDFTDFREFAYKKYFGKLTSRTIRDMELIDLSGENGLIVKTWGHALSQQLNYLKAGTPQYERWKNIEIEFEDYLVCIATQFGIYVLKYPPDDLNGNKDERLFEYQDEVKSLFRGAIAGKYDEEVAERTGVAGGSVPSFFGDKDDEVNNQDILSGPEESVMGYWRNTSMKFGSTDIILVKGGQSNSLDLHNNREYDYSAHTQGANPVVTRGNWRYYRNGPRAYLALEHSHQKMDGVFKPVPKKRENVFLIREISATKMILFEEKDDPEWSVTLVYEK